MCSKMLRSISDFFYCENYIFFGLFGELLSIVCLMVIFLKNILLFGIIFTIFAHYVCLREAELNSVCQDS